MRGWNGSTPGMGALPRSHAPSSPLSRSPQRRAAPASIAAATSPPGIAPLPPPPPLAIHASTEEHRWMYQTRWGSCPRLAPKNQAGSRWVPDTWRWADKRRRLAGGGDNTPWRGRRGWPRCVSGRDCARAGTGRGQARPTRNTPPGPMGSRRHPHMPPSAARRPASPATSGSPATPLGNGQGRQRRTETGHVGSPPGLTHTAGGARGGRGECSPEPHRQ